MAAQVFLHGIFVVVVVYLIFIFANFADVVDLEEISGSEKTNNDYKRSSIVASLKTFRV